MIVLNVTYQCRPGLRETFLERITAEGIEAACRAEPGNICYDYFIPTDGSDTLLLVEKWQNAEALAAHAQLPHMVKLRALKAEYTTDTRIERFDPPA